MPIFGRSRLSATLLAIHGLSPPLAFGAMGTGDRLCNKAHAAGPGYWDPLVDLAAANAWAGHDKEAKEAAAQLQKVYPGFTVQKWADIHWTDDPTFNAQYARITEGLRKAGLPEGDKPADAAAAKTSN